MKSLTGKVLTILAWLLLSGITLILPISENDTTLVERQIGCFNSVPCTLLIGNGDPHQQILHKQLSVTRNCGDTDCRLSPAEVKSYELTADFHGLRFITGNYAIVERLNTGAGTGDLCGATAGRSVCLWTTIWHTDLTAQGGRKNPCLGGCHTSLPDVIVRAPNALREDNYIEYYCAFDDDCGDQGQEWWLQGPAGGPPDPPVLDKRQTCVPSGSCTRRDGDGNPHQWILHKQLSDKFYCGGGHCTPDATISSEYTVSANTHGADWIDGEFNVVESVKTGIYEGCIGNPGQAVCAVAKIWHTDYTVRTGVTNSCAVDGCMESKDTTIIRSPNAIDQGISYVCAVDDECADRGAETWEYDREGGPRPSAAPDKREDRASSISGGSPAPASAALDERGCEKPCAEQNGDPHQMILRKQVSDTLHCIYVAGDTPLGCPVDLRTAKGYDVVAQVPEGAVWDDFGMPVSQSVWTGLPPHYEPIISPQCIAMPGESVCAFADVWYTTVPEKAGTINTCNFTGQSPHDACKADAEFVISSPNNIKDEINFTCGKNEQCGSIGAETWIDAHVTGGPPAAPAPAPAALEERDCHKESCLEIANGPAQWIVRKQISTPYFCDQFQDGPGCDIPENSIRSYDVKYNIPKGGKWDDFGYAISKSVNTGVPGDSDKAGGPWPAAGECHANPGEIICMHADIWSTAITERVGTRDMCVPNWTPPCEGSEITISAPNTIKDKVNYHCRKGNDCAEDAGHETWINANVNGGPP